MMYLFVREMNAKNRVWEELGMNTSVNKMASPDRISNLSFSILQALLVEIIAPIAKRLLRRKSNEIQKQESDQSDERMTKVPSRI